MRGGTHKPIEPKKSTPSKEKLTSDDQRVKEFLQDNPTIDHVAGLQFLIKSETGELHDIDLKKLECDCRAKLNRPNVNCKHLVGSIILLGIRTSGFKRLIYAQEKKELLALERQLQNKDGRNWTTWINNHKEKFLEKLEPTDDMAPLNCRFSDPRTLLVKEYNSFNEAKEYINTEAVFWRVIKAPKNGYKCPNHGKEDEEEQHKITKGQIVFEANCYKINKTNGKTGPYINQKHKRLFHSNCITNVNENSKPLAFTNIKLPITSRVFVSELDENQLTMLKEYHGHLNFTQEEPTLQKEDSVIENVFSEKSGTNEMENDNLSSSLLDNLEADFTEDEYQQQDNSSSILQETEDSNFKEDKDKQARTRSILLSSENDQLMDSINDPEFIPSSEPTSESLNVE